MVKIADISYDDDSFLNKQLVTIYRTLDIHRTNKNNVFFFGDFFFNKINWCVSFEWYCVCCSPRSYKYEMGEV